MTKEMIREIFKAGAQAMYESLTPKVSTMHDGKVFKSLADETVNKYSIDILIMIHDIAKLHEYRVLGKRETYSKYNEGWEDACGTIETKLLEESK